MVPPTNEQIANRVDALDGILTDRIDALEKRLHQLESAARMNNQLLEQKFAEVERRLPKNLPGGVKKGLFSR